MTLLRLLIYVSSLLFHTPFHSAKFSAASGMTLALMATSMTESYHICRLTEQSLWSQQRTDLVALSLTTLHSFICCVQGTFLLIIKIKANKIDDSKLY